jgi:pimeloyl-ACP methyl ester carboxylesterase
MGWGLAHAQVITFSARDLTEGTKLTPDQCAALPKAVFVVSFNEGICIRYYVGGVARGRMAAVFMPGDVLGLNAKNERVAEPGYLTQAPEYVDAAVNVWSRRFGQPVIFLGRLGMHGSSGWHGDRRTVFEVDVTLKALDAIKAREGLTGYHVAGQSGGALIAMAAVAKRNDIGCAAIASGPLDLAAFLKSGGIPWRKDGRRAHYDMMADAPEVAAHSQFMRVMMLTDPTDVAVPRSVQDPFAAKVMGLGGKILRIFTAGRGKEHHALTEKAMFSLAMCVNGASDAEILKRYGNTGPEDLPPP